MYGFEPRRISNEKIARADFRPSRRDVYVHHFERYSDVINAVAAFAQFVLEQDPKQKDSEQQSPFTTGQVIAMKRHGQRRDRRVRPHLLSLRSCRQRDPNHHYLSSPFRRRIAYHVHRVVDSPDGVAGIPLRRARNRAIVIRSRQRLLDLC